MDLETHIQDVMNLIRWEELSDIVLCGHSYGGCVVSGVADRVPAQQIDAYEGRMTQMGDYNAAFESMPAGFPPDPRAAFRGLPDDACQSEHWGYLFKGRLAIAKRSSTSSGVTRFWS